MNLSEPTELRRFLTKHRLLAEKSLGQHFLCSGTVVDAIVRRLESMAGIMEIGPGPGVLTAHLAQWDRKLIAIELDAKMLPALKDSAPYAEVLRQDALKSDFRSILSGLPEPRGIVGNLPYYITGPLIHQIAEVHDCFSVAVLMMQKEVADRIVAPPGDGDRGSVSVFLQFKFEMSVVEQVPPTAFLPPPKVKSTVLAFVPRTEIIEDEDGLFRFVKLGFSQPRKTLANNLSSGLQVEREVVVAAIEGLGLRVDARAHHLSQGEWVGLFERLGAK